MLKHEIQGRKWSEWWMCRQAGARTRRGFLQPGTRSAESKQEASDRLRDSQVTQWKRTCLPIQETRVAGSIPGPGRFPEGGSGNPLQYSCLGNPMDRGAWWATVQGVARSRTRLNTQAADRTSGRTVTRPEGWCHRTEKRKPT